MAIPFTAEQMKEMGYTNWRELPDGTILAVGSMNFGNGRLFIDIDYCGYANCYCYDSLDLAEKSMLEFNPEVDEEPKYWKRHPFTDRYRENGDPNKETVRR